MAAVTFTSVRIATNTNVDKVDCGATVTAGQPVYSDTTDSNKAKVSDATTLAKATVKGIAVNAGVSGGGLVVATSGSLILVGASMTVGKTYYLSATSGAIIPEADLASTNYVTRLGTASAATQLELDITVTGVQYA